MKKAHRFRQILLFTSPALGPN